jgi:hypothetical protein
MPTMVLRDGTKLRIKEGADPDAVYAQYMKDRAAPAAPAPTSPTALTAEDVERMGPLQTFTRGAGAGAMDVLQGAGNMVGLVDDETIQRRKADQAALMESTGGKIGNFVGNTAALLPVTMAAGAGLGAGAAPLAAGVGLRAALARSAGSGLLNMGAQGALAGAINANPNERGKGAALGGAFGAGVGGVLKGGARLYKGLANYSDDALALQKELPNSHIPLHVGLSETDVPSRVLKSAYGLASEAPLSGTMLKKQLTGLSDDLVGTAGKRAMPTGTGIPGQTFTSGSTPASGAANLNLVKTIVQQIDDIQAPIKSVVFDIKPKNGRLLTTYGKTVAKALSDLNRSNPQLKLEVQKAIDEAISPGFGTTKGENVLNAISKLKRMRSEVGGTSATGSAAEIDKVIKAFERWGAERLSTTPANLANLKPAWDRTMKLRNDELWAWENFKRAVAESNSGSVSARDLVSGLEGGTTSFATGQVPGQGLATLGKKVTVDELAKMGGAFNTNIRLGALSPVLTGAAGYGLLGVPGMAAGAALLPALATKGVQRGLTGQFASQKALAEALRNNPDMLRQIMSGAIPAMTPQGEYSATDE